MWFTHRQLTVKRITNAAASNRQQPGILECTCQFLLRRGRRQRRMCIEVGARVSEHLVLIGNKLQLLFFGIFRWFCLMFNCRQTHFVDLWHCKDASPSCICLTISLCFCLFYHRAKFGNGVFPHPVYFAKMYDDSVTGREH